MNFALPAALILLIALPGFVFRYAYNSGVFRRSPFRTLPFTDKLFLSLFFAGLFHITGAIVVPWVSPVTIDFGVVLTLLTQEAEQLPSAIANIKAHFPSILGYFFATYVAAWALGMLFHFCVRRSRLDLRFELFRFDNPWHYLLSGENRWIHRLYESDEPPSVSAIAPYVSAVIDQGEQPYIYHGLLVDYFLNKHGELKTLHLKYVGRRTLAEDAEPTRLEGETEPLYEIKGDYLAIDMQTVRTLNVVYYDLVPWDEEDEEETEAPAS